MKTWQFFLVYGKRTVRDKMFFMIMLLFPVILIWLLGSAFAGIMGDNGSEGLVKARMLYLVDDETAVSESFVQHMVDEDNEYFIFELTDDREDAIGSIVRNKYDAFIELSKDTITVYKNSNYNFSSSLGELILKSFADNYNLMYEIGSLGIHIIPGEDEGSISGFIEEVSFDKERTPGSMDYYGITMSTMFIFYGMIFLGTYIAENKRLKTADRIKASPVSMLSYQWGTAAGSVVLLMMQAALVILAGIFVFNVYWGGALHIGAITIIAEIIMVSALGTLLGLTLKNENVIAGISQILIPLIVFLGDGYVNIGGSGIIMTIKKISPMYWVNHGIFDAIYLGDYSKAFIAVAICLGVAVLCTVAVMAVNNRKEAVNA